MAKVAHGIAVIYELIAHGTLDETINVPVNVQTLASWLMVTEKTIKRDLSAMQTAGAIKRVGSDKTGHWEVIQ